MNLPNTLTAFRIFLVPLLVVILLTGRFPDREIWGLVVLVAAALTDYFDGFLARRRHQVTAMGKLLDPIADKLLISAAFVSLVELGLAPAWMVVIIIGREFAVTGLRSVAATEGIAISASRLGKYKMASQVLCVGCLIGGRLVPETPIMSLARLLLWLVVILAIVSMIHYFQRFWSRIDGNGNVRGSRREKPDNSLSLLTQPGRGTGTLMKSENANPLS